MITVAEADDIVTGDMLQDENEHEDREFVPGDDKSDPIPRVSR